MLRPSGFVCFAALALVVSDGVTAQTATGEPPPRLKLSPTLEPPPETRSWLRRARDLGLTIGILPVGPLNCITDVAGLQVGHTTISRGENIRTGVTAILPHNGNLFRDKVPGAVFIGNAFGKLAGL